MDELTQLAIKYGTDKWGKHHYTPVYYDLFKTKNLEVMKVLEIGSAEGAGVRMFRDFFPNAQVYGLDNVPERIFKEDRIKIYYFDQSKDEEYKDFYPLLGDGFDLIIDDGSHKPEDQIKSALNLIDYTSLYIIEDVADSDLINRLKVEFIKKNRELSYVLNEVRVGNRFDDRLIIINHE